MNKKRNYRIKTNNSFCLRQFALKTLFTHKPLPDVIDSCVTNYNPQVIAV